MAEKLHNNDNPIQNEIEMETPDKTGGSKGENTLPETELEETRAVVPYEDFLALQSEYDEIASKADEYLDGWQRARAEFANYKKRVDREKEQAYQNAAGNILKRYLEVIDDIERALKNKPHDGDGAAWAEGIELIYRKLLQILENEGIKPMDADGQMFDPNRHEAILSMPSEDHESGQIIEVLQRGYMIGDRVLRPAMVRVAQ